MILVNLKMIVMLMEDFNVEMMGNGVMFVFLLIVMKDIFLILSIGNVLKMCVSILFGKENHIFGLFLLLYFLLLYLLDFLFFGK
jgi:hypothetical protein